MATNFWTSSHCKTLCTKEALLAGHSADGAKGLTADQVQQLTIFHVQCVNGIICTLPHPQHYLKGSTVSTLMRCPNELSCDAALQISVTWPELCS